MGDNKLIPFHPAANCVARFAATPVDAPFEFFRSTYEGITGATDPTEDKLESRGRGILLGFFLGAADMTWRTITFGQFKGDASGKTCWQATEYGPLGPLDEKSLLHGEAKMTKNIGS